MPGGFNNENLTWVVESKDTGELKERYDKWGAGYEKEIIVEGGFLAPAKAAEAVAARMPADAKILDAGAGTGAVGAELAKRGFKHITGLDMSVGMLEVAKAKGVYEAFVQAELGKKLDLETAAFDATTCVATFTVGHAPAIALEELARVTKPGGIVVFSLRPDIYEEHGFKEVQDRLAEQGKWKLAEHSDPYHPLPKTEPHVWYDQWVYEILK